MTGGGAKEFTISRANGTRPAQDLSSWNLKLHVASDHLYH
jgi:hypothetical protein